VSLDSGQQPSVQESFNQILAIANKVHQPRRLFSISLKNGPEPVRKSPRNLLLCFARVSTRDVCLGHD
jgi:hypothetical protein